MKTSPPLFSQLCLFSPAKVNLFLRVACKRQDGYHHLSSLFQAISLGDLLYIERHPTDILSCSDDTLPIDQTNLVLRATELFRRKTGYQGGFNIHLEKKIPVQAGLGGGSSNAATTLWGCCQLAGISIPSHTLGEWGSEIGSDIPFFFSLGRAYCTGRGEEVKPLPFVMPTLPWAIFKPPEGLSTAHVYQHLNCVELNGIEKVAEDYRAAQEGKWSYFNDLETAAYALSPSLLQWRDQLRACGFEEVLLSGSGSAFLCVGTGKQSPAHITDQMIPVTPVHRLPTEWYSLENQLIFDRDDK